jgi:hypothetical protein
MIVLTQLPVHGSYLSDVLPGLLPIGLGMGLTFVPLTLTATSESTGEDAGLISGLLNTAQQIGGSIGLAVLATLAAGRTTRLVRTSAAHRSVAAAQVSGFHLAFTAAAILLGAAWLIVAVQLRTHRARQLQPRYEVTPSAAAQAIGCAQCAPVAIGAGRAEPQPASGT